MNLEWNGSSAHAKAIHEWADDGSYDTRLEWDENIECDPAGTHYKYDERGNLIHRLHNGSHAHFTWDLWLHPVRLGR